MKQSFNQGLKLLLQQLTVFSQYPNHNIIVTLQYFVAELLYGAYSLSHY